MTNTRRRRASHGVVMSHVIRDGTLSANARLLYAVLCTYANGGGESFPKVETVLDDMGLSDRTRRRAQDELVAAGYLQITEQSMASGRQTQNLYLLTDEPPDVEPVDTPGTPARAPGYSPGTGAGGDPGTGAGGTPARAPGYSPGTGAAPRTTIGNNARACVHGRPPHMCQACTERHGDTHPVKCEHNHQVGACPWCPGGRLAHLEPT